MDLLSNLLCMLNFLTIIYKVNGFPGGDFPESCQSMAVQHSDRGVEVKPQTDEAPFEVVPVVVGPDLITVTLRSKGRETFEGFMLEARKKDNRDLIVGQFLVLDPHNTHLLTCNGLAASAVSQSTNNNRRLFKVNWTSGKEELDVIFRATFLYTFTKFWKPFDTDVIIPSSTSKPSTAPIMTSTTESSPKPTALVSTAPRQPVDIRKYSPEVTFDVFVVCSVMTITSSVASNAKNHVIMKWIRRCGSILALALELSALILLVVSDKVINPTLLGLAIVMSAIGAITLFLTFCNIGRSHELWVLYDHFIDVLLHIQKVFAVAFIYVSTSHCQRWLLNVLISFTVWIVLQTTYVVIAKILKATGSRNKKAIDRVQKSQSFAAAVVIILSVPNIAFCVAIVVGICQC